jgi:hypothetical protein
MGMGGAQKTTKRRGAFRGGGGKTWSYGWFLEKVSTNVKRLFNIQRKIFAIF